MRSKKISCRIAAFAAIFALFSAIPLNSFAQVTVTRCATTPVVINTGSASMAPITFSAADFPTLTTPQIVNIEVEVTWSVEDNACGSGLTGPVNTNLVGFNLTDPTIGTQLFAIATSWPGTNPVSSIVTTFAENGTLLPSAPATGTYTPFGTTMSNYWGDNPLGNWTFDVSHAGAGADAPVCVESVCITIEACEAGSLTASCQSNITLALDSSGTLALEFADLDNSSDTSCYLNSVSFTPNNFTCADHNTSVNIDMTLIDRLGNSSTCTANNITIVDNLPPSIPECVNPTTSFDTVYVDAAGLATLNASTINATDACGVLVELISEQTAPPFTMGPQRVFDCTNLGLNVVVLQAIDINNNTQPLMPSPFSVNGCQAQVSVMDTIPPTAICQDTTVYLDAAGSFTINPTFVNDNSFDNCRPAGLLTYLVDNAATITYTCADLGANTVTMTVRDNLSPAQGGTSSSTCTATVTVLDTVAPVANCSNLDVYLDAAGNATVAAADVAATSTDNSTACSPLSYSFASGPTVSYTCTDLGAQPVSVTVTDAQSNFSVCSATLNVQDTLAPVMVCTNFTANLDATGNIVVNPSDIDGGTADACSAVTLSINGLPSVNFTCADIGVQNVTLIAEDAQGNIDSCAAQVIVEDNLAPSAVCQNIDAFLDATGNVVVNAADIDGGSSDNCAITITAINGGNTETYTCVDIGIQNATLEVADAVGNSNTCIAQVTVQDTVSPTVTCQNITAALDPASGQVTVTAADVILISNDNCGIISSTINAAASVTYTCANIGANAVTIEVADGQALTATCAATVTVADTSAPVMACTNFTIALDAAGNATVLPSDIDGGTIDNCGLPTLSINGLASQSYDCTDIGVQNATLIGTDLFGNIDSCTAQVTIQDNIAPTAICQNINAYLDATGLVTVLAAELDGGSTDNCNITSYTINNQPSLVFSCADIAAPQNVTLEVFDQSTNSSTCPATITVLDTVSPIANCQATPVQAILSPTGTVTVSAATIDNGSTDNCGTTTLLINGLAQETYDCTDLGLNNATLTVTDNSTNSSTCIAQVEVVDNLAPLALCASPTVYLDNAGLVTITPAEITDPASSDNCGIVSSLINNAATATYTCADLTVVLGAPVAATLQLEDASGNPATCPAQVTVEDTISPVAICTNILVQLDASGQAVVNAAQIDGGSSDNCGITTILIDGAPSVIYGCADIGATLATLTVQDASGNQSSCTATVTVVDASAPVAVCQNITVYLDATGQIVVPAAQIDGGSTDNCTPLTFLINNQPSFTYTCAQAGLTVPAQLSVSDPSGNSTICLAQVTVLDTISPVASCNTPLDVFLGTGGTVTVTATQINAGSTDNCSITSVDINGSSAITFDCTAIGANLVTLTVQDGSSNTGTCVSTVNITDTLNPIPLCKNITAYLDASGQVVVNPADVDNGSSDNCGVPSLAFSSGASITYDCTSIGPNAVTLVATDGSGNVDSCSSFVTVLDTVSPIALCQNITVQLDPVSGQVTVNAAQIDGGSSDNCAIASILINGSGTQNYDCGDVGANNAVLTVIDATGNNQTCIAIVTVEDASAPAMACQNITVQLDAAGNATIFPANIDAGTTDNCGISSLTLSGAASLSFGCADVGPNTVTLVATDVNNNVDSCQATVTVEDNVNPNVVCANIDVYLDATGAVTIFPADVDGGSSDNCAISTSTINAAASITFGCADVGPNAVTLEITDVNGNSDNCIATVTVLDTIDPVINCQNIVVQLDAATGLATITAADILNSATDNCGIQDSTINGLASVTYDCSNIGANNVTVVVTDDNGNSATCLAIVTVEDNTPPAMACQNITVQLDASGQALVLPADIDAGTTDNCAIASLTISGQASVTLDCSNAGNNILTLVAEDVNGNIDSCQAIVTVQDTIDPTAVCQTFDAYLDNSGNIIVNPSDVDGGSTDNCAITVSTINSLASLSFGCADVGPNNVTLEVIDASANSSTCLAIVNVIDTISPTANCQPVTRNLNASGFVVVNPLAMNAGSSDACGIASYALSQDSFTCADLGPNTVTLYVTDVNGNVDSCQNTITIQDIDAPNVACQNISVFLDPSGQVTVNAAQVDNGSTDNCSIDNMTINGAASITYSCIDVGTQPVTLTVFDGSGNNSSCFAQITIQDTVPPIAQCQNLTVQLDAAGSALINVTSIDNGSTDNCGIASTLFNNGTSILSFDCSQVGTNAVTMVVTDLNGNVDSCQAIVTVEDNVAPTALCQAATVFVDAAGVANVLATDVDGGSSDACGIDTMTVAPSTLDCSNIAVPAQVTLTVIDVNGNQSTCPAQVLVVDTVPPTMVCDSIDAYVDNVGIVNVTAAEIDNGTTDACGLAQLLINSSSNQVYTCLDLGVNNATLTGIDIYGNSASCIAEVTVLDTVSPTASCRNPFEVYLSTALGTATVVPADVDSLSVDNCNVNTAAYLINGLPSITYVCSDLTSPQNVILTVVDDSGNSSTCTTTITVRDTSAPAAACVPTLNLNLSAINGTATVNAFSLDDGSTDACAPPLSYLINGQAFFQYTCADIGANVATLSVTDASGNVGTCTSTIVVNDITPPNAQCIPGQIINLDSTGISTIQAVDLNNNSTDNCSIASFEVNNAASIQFNCQDIGNNLVTLTVTDSSGNSSTCTSVITIRDLEPPTMVCPTTPVEVFLDASGLVNVSGTMLDSASYDNCGIQTYLINGTLSQNFGCSNIGLNNAILTVRDSSNNINTCSVQIEVRDTVSPVAQCQNITVNLNGTTGGVFVNAIAIDNGSSDNCGITSYLINGFAQDTFDCSNVGQNVAVLTVFDNYGNSSQCQATVTVVDNAAPVVQCTPGTFFLDNTGLVQVLPTDLATGIDACGIVNWTIDGSQSKLYDCTAAGTTFQDTITAFDQSGNSASCIAQVTIQDTISPVAQCQNIIAQLDSSGNVIVLPTQVDNNSFDNCSIVSYLINGQPSISFTCADTGANVVTLRVTDQSGNQSICTATVTVVDNIAPIASCRNLTVQLNSSGTVTIPAINLNDASTDACGPLSFTIGGQPSITYNCSSVGLQSASLEVTDANGNVSTCTSIITIEDLIPPTAVCTPYTLYLDNAGNGTVFVADVVDAVSSFDNCAINQTTVNNSLGVVYDCSSVGLDTVMVIMSDFNGNFDTCFAEVTIEDSIPPTIISNGAPPINLTNVTSVTLDLATLNVAVSDACGMDTVIINPTVITCADAGVVPVEIVAIDVNGNQSVDTTLLTVLLDGPAPTASPAFPPCEGQTLGLFANPPSTGFTYTYSWEGPNGFTSNQANPVITNVQAANEGFYIVTITPQGVPGAGCSTSDTVYVDINVVLPPDLTFNAPLCLGNDAVLSVSNSASYVGDTITYQWFQDGVAVGPDSNIYDIPAVSFADTGLYTMVVTVDGCTDSTTTPMSLVVNPLPAAFTPIFEEPCDGDTLNIVSNAPATGPFTYSWEGPNAYTSTDSIATLFPVGFGDEGVYSVTITDPNSCTATSNISVTILPTPSAPDINYNNPLCLDDLLELTDTTNYIGVVSYVWFGPDGSAIDTTAIPQLVIPNAADGTYGLVVIENGCVSPSDTTAVIYEPVPAATDNFFTVPFRDSITGMDVTVDDVVRTGYSVGIVDSAANGWITLNSNNTFNYQPGYVYFGIDSFLYEVCDPVCPTVCDTATVFVDVQFEERCFIPNGLSPNGDGVNDALIVVCEEEYPNMQIQIFSRWGNKVYEGDPNGWDVRFNGKDLPDGAYFYLLNYGDGTPSETGYIIVHR